MPPAGRLETPRALFDGAQAGIPVLSVSKSELRVLPQGPRYGVQVAAIIRTLSTFSFGAAEALALLDADELELLEDGEAASTVPEISTLWPTCGVSLLASASRR